MFGGGRAGEGGGWPTWVTAGIIITLATVGTTARVVLVVVSVSSEAMAVLAVEVM